MEDFSESLSVANISTRDDVENDVPNNAKKKVTGSDSSVEIAATFDDVKVGVMDGVEASFYIAGDSEQQLIQRSVTDVDANDLGQHAVKNPESRHEVLMQDFGPELSLASNVENSLLPTIEIITTDDIQEEDIEHSTMGESEKESCITHNAANSSVTLDAIEDVNAVPVCDENQVTSGLEEEDVDVICGKCGKHFSDITTLSWHLKLHSKIQKKIAASSSGRSHRTSSFHFRKASFSKLGDMQSHNKTARGETGPGTFSKVSSKNKRKNSFGTKPEHEVNIENVPLNYLDCSFDSEPSNANSLGHEAKGNVKNASLNQLESSFDTPPSTSMSHTCLQCGERLASFSVLQAHLGSVHGNTVTVSGDEQTWHACPKCSKPFSSARMLEGHVKVCDTVQSRGKTAGLQQSLIVSLEKVNVASRTCPACRKIFSDDDSMWLHFESSHAEFDKVDGNDEGAYEKDDEFSGMTMASPKQGSKTCPVCWHNFSQNGAMWRHLRSIHPVEFGIYVRKENAKSSLEDVHFHSNSGTPIMFSIRDGTSCLECKRDFTSPGYLKRHIRRFHDEQFNTDRGPPTIDDATCGEEDIDEACDNSYTCTECHSMFSELDYLRTHALIEHSDTEPEYQIQAKMRGDDARTCKECGLLLSNPGIVREHYRKVHTNKRTVKFEMDDDSDVSPTTPGSTVVVQFTNIDEHHSCDDCGKYFLQLEDLEWHVSTYHAKFTCVECDKVFHSKFGLKQHMHIHTGTRQQAFVCKQCGKSFSSSRYLKKHELTHAGLRPFHCDICGRTFTQKHTLKLHVLLHTGGGEYPCFDCGKRCVGPAALARHRRVHTGERPFSCETCGKSFTGTSALKKHQFTHSGERPYVCTICNTGFSTNGSLKAHQVVHTKERPYECTECKKKFSSTSILNRHVKTHTGERPFICDLCGQDFAENSKMVIHRRSHTGETPFQCSECGKSFISKRKLARHMGVHNPQFCNECGKSYADPFTLKLHMLTHTGERPHQCHVCPKTFRTAAVLRSHLITHSGRKPFVCDICGKGFSSTMALRNHKTLHTGDRPFKCDQCEKRFPTQSTLNVHRLFHSKDKQHECPECGRKFHRIYELRKHAQVHSDERPYACDHCHKTFKHSSTLRDHINTHTQLNWYSCSECGKTFLRYYSLRKHEKTHLKEKPYSCSECDKKFTRKEHLKKHLMSIHNTLGLTFSCDVCSATFGSSDGLKKHMEVHEGEDVAMEIGDKMEIIEELVEQ